MNGQKTTVVVRLILEKEDKILFLKKTAQNGGGFSLVGGKVDDGESAHDAIVRESHEEANIEIKRKHLRLLHIFQRYSGSELILLFTAKKWKGEPESKELEKFKKVSWIAKTDLPKNVSQVTKHLVDKYFSGKFFSEENTLRGINK
ncbi:MAG: NUDIX domain-containing protein [Saprospiraceae bacterium]